MKYTGIMVFGMVAIVLSGCVTTHYGQTNSLAQDRIQASCSEPQYLTSDFASVSCTFQNMTHDWIDIEAAQATFNHSGVIIHPLTPAQTLAFMKSYQFEKEKHDQNFDIAMGSLAVMGLAVGALSGNKSIASTGAAVGLGAIAAGTGKHVIDKVHEAQYPQYGEDHLLGPATSIPARLFVRRTMIFQSSTKKLNQSRLEICMKLPQVECFDPALSFESARTRTTNPAFDIP